ncbi:hypothetical protein HOLleu_08222 [Holothuria leucospilota]|uniref:Uncharacterized protein n=1 Tax=Holothuria leucospilota TaxID=206669 RepID=A0A9Q1HDB6_HOLLE|nr:hypothetical protein HOLleu_08222 [Holothuria leucospilota]
MKLSRFQPQVNLKQAHMTSYPHMNGLPCFREPLRQIFSCIISCYRKVNAWQDGVATWSKFQLPPERRGKFYKFKFPMRSSYPYNFKVKRTHCKTTTLSNNSTLFTNVRRWCKPALRCGLCSLLLTPNTFKLALPKCSNFICSYLENYKSELNGNFTTMFRFSCSFTGQNRIWLKPFL